jgi:sulfite dehydrogenase (cytochrome) subunit B
MTRIDMLKTAGLALTLTLAATSARAEEQPIELKAAPGKDVVENNCAACHSLDYIQMNAPFPTSRKWEETVHKMIEVFGAPIDEGDARKITEYLAKHYGS